MPNGMSKLLHISDRYNYFSITQRYRISINSVKRAHGFLFLWEPSPVMGLSLTLISFWGLSPTTVVVGRLSSSTGFEPERREKRYTMRYTVPVIGQCSVNAILDFGL